MGHLHCMTIAIRFPNSYQESVLYILHDYHLMLHENFGHFGYFIRADLTFV